jgi:signal peptidase I
MSAVIAATPAARRSFPIKKIAGWLVFIALAAGWTIFLRPIGLGGPANYVTVSGESMEPTMFQGDFVITRQQSEYQVGDVLVYRIEEGEVGEGGLVIHRIIGGSMEEGFVTQGDNRDKPDLWYPKGDEIVGEVWLKMPGAGKWLPYIRSPFVIAGFAAMLAFSFVMTLEKEEEDEVAKGAEDAGDAENDEDPA